MKNTILCSVFFLSLSIAKADIIFSNFSAGSPSFDTNTGITLNDSGGNDLKTSLSFVPSATYRLTQLDLVTSLASVSETNLLDLTISSDSGGNPGAVLETFTFNGSMGVLGTNPSILTATSVLNPFLVNGSTYWITAEAAPNARVVWNFNNQSPNDTGLVDQFSGGSWSSRSLTRGVFDVQGTLSNTPEPGSIMLLGAGLVGLVLSRRR